MNKNVQVLILLNGGLNTPVVSAKKSFLQRLAQFLKF